MTLNLKAEASTHLKLGTDSRVQDSESEFPTDASNSILEQIQRFDDPGPEEQKQGHNTPVGKFLSPSRGGGIQKFKAIYQKFKRLLKVLKKTHRKYIF